MDTKVSMIEIAGIKTELVECGAGRPLLFLHPGIGIDAKAPVIEAMADSARVLAPSHPGFGRSEQPKAMTTIDDLAYFYLDAIEALGLKDAIVVGVSFGAWIAAEIAVKSCERIGHLVLADAFGIKVGDRETRDIADIFAMTEPQFNERAYFDPAFAARDYKSLPEADLVIVARNREAMARYGWSPYMHDPKLKGRLHRIRAKTLVLWGAADRIAAPDYGRAWSVAIPGARFALIERAGHFPHLEAPGDFARHVLEFAAA
ncbi:MAG TPA: alpha/beta fold hydrolase [Stellaceae bacterium]|nr:alpha/beta fold hydrolase [Stellaceae bacterium]